MGNQKAGLNSTQAENRKVTPIRCVKCEEPIKKVAVRMEVVERRRTNNVFRRVFFWKKLKPTLFFHPHCITEPQIGKEVKTKVPKIERIRPEEVRWRGGARPSKYQDILEHLKGMAVGEACRVTFEKPAKHVHNRVLPVYREKEYGFAIKTRCLDEHRMVWAILKIEKPDRRGRRRRRRNGQV